MGLLKKYLSRLSDEEILDNYFLSKGFKRNGDFAEKDIFIVGFPKSGNTWMQHLMSGILYGCDMSKIHNNLVRELVPDVHQFKYYKRYNDRMAFKTHSLPEKVYKNVVYLIRDGRDALTSFYNMEKGRSKANSFEEIVKNNKGLICSWNKHINSWMQNPYQANMMIIKYEDLIADTFQEIKKICVRFDINTDDEFLKKVISNCSFSEMRKKEKTVFWEKSKEWQNNQFFVRKGEVGSYKLEMPEQLIVYFEKNNRDILQKFNYQITK